jgi:putative Mg2+ transporter-C (MgtC) family protein
VVAEWDLVARIAAAGVMGAALGLEREWRSGPAGLRTHALVAVGAALFTVAGAYGFADVAKGPNVDPARVAAQVATGIGFVGAGAIIKSGASVRGLTTASTLWVAAALGMASGAGAWAVALAGLAAVFAVLLGLRLAGPWIMRRLSASGRILEVEYERGHGTLGPLVRELERMDARMGPLHLDDDDEGSSTGLRRVMLEVRTSDDEALERLLANLSERSEVQSASVRRGRIANGRVAEAER